MSSQNSTVKPVGHWVVIALVILALSLTACGGGSDEAMETPTAEATLAPVPPTAVPTEAPTAAPTEAPTEAPTVEGSAAMTETVPATETTAMTGTTAPTVEETTTITATKTTTETGAAAPAAPAASALSGDALVAAATAAITKGTCNACHMIPGIEGAVGMIGPNLGNIGTDAATRVPGLSAEEYIHQSIMEPDAFIAPDCPTGPCLPGLMLKNLPELLTPDEITTVVTYLLTLHGQN